MKKACIGTILPFHNIINLFFVGEYIYTRNCQYTNVNKEENKTIHDFKYLSITFTTKIHLFIIPINTVLIY